MKEFIEKLLGRLEEEKYTKAELFTYDEEDMGKMIFRNNGINKAIEIVNQLSEEYDDINIITDFLQYVRDNADNYDADNGWDLSDLIDLSIKFCDAEEHNGGWIPCSERLPEVSGEYYTYVYYDGHYMYSVDEIDCDGMVKKWNCTSDYKVVAWKPITPYQPKGE